MDKVTSAERSRIMSKVKSVETAPEVAVRKALFRLGFRYRKNVAGLFGKPDIVLKKYKAIVFIHGCFWHQHPNCKEAMRPASHTDYWNKKLERNVERDKMNVDALKKAGWRVFVVWECELRSSQFQATIEKLSRRIREGADGWH